MIDLMNCDNPVRVGVTGIRGRMGSSLVHICHQDPRATLTLAVDRPGSAVLGRDAGEVSGLSTLGVLISDDLAAGMHDIDVLVEFTHALPAISHLDMCLRAGKPIVLGPTGFTPDQKEMILDASRRIPVVFAPNMSVGVNLTLKLLQMTARIIGEYTDIEIIEAHHRHKLDAPSGTALRMGEVIAEELGIDLSSSAVYGREGIGAERQQGTIGFSSVRAGDIVGEHTVMFAAEGERLEITHKASSRLTFARGAILAAKWLVDKPAGLYDMQDVLGLK
ncbi:MAG: hypothetical protein RIQ52_1489 [Pseudomonadota bacterium]|jgi:4-hydroxy-tetrahydrodipicolinate reductase